MADSSSTVENFQYKQMVEQETAPSAPLPMITVSFSGSGLADLTAGTAFNQVAMATFVITIAGTGSPNTFDWTKTGGSGSSSASGVSITGSAQTLDDGFQITFGATTGHTAGNAWTIKCLPRARMYWDSTGAIQQKWSNGTTTSVGGGAPSGSAGGDLSGTYPNPTVAKINGATVGTATATSGNLLIGSGTAWVSNAVTGDVTINSTGVTAIGATKVTNAMLAGSIQASKLVGTDITTVGTITSGTWNGTAIAASYLADTAVTPGTYNFSTITVDQQGRITSASTGTPTVTLSSITAATGDSTATNHANNIIQWNWTTLAGRTAFTFNSAGTAAASNAQRLVAMYLSGNNASASQTTTCLDISNTHTNSSTNVGINVSTTGGTNNYAATLVGSVGIGLTAPTSILHVRQASDSTNTSTPVMFNVDSAGATGELTASSSTQTFAQIAPTVNQSGTAGYTALKINSTQTATGSGSKLLTDWQVGGTSLASINSAGQYTVASGTITASTPFITQTATWNSGGVTFVNALVNITDTASATASKFIDYQVGGSSKLYIDKAGQIVTTNVNGTIHELGYLKVGHFFDAGVGFSGIANAAMATGSLGTDYCVIQDGNGASYLNAKSGQNVSFRINNTEYGILTGTTWDLTGATSVKAKQFNQTVNAFGNSGTSFTLNWSTGAVQTVTLTGNVTSITLSNPIAGTRYIIYLATGAGSFTVTGWPAAVKWAGGTAPTITATASKTDKIILDYDGTSYFGQFVQNY